MPEDSDPFELLGLLGKGLDGLVTTLAEVGITLPAWATQAVLALLALLLLAAAVKSLRKLRLGLHSAPLLVVAAVLGLVALSVVWVWIDHWLRPLPDHVFGRVEADQIQDVRVSVLSLQDEIVSLGSGRLDTADGSFALRYKVGLGDRPAALRIHREGCRPFDHPTSRAQVRARVEFHIAYPCEPES